MGGGALGREGGVSPRRRGGKGRFARYTFGLPEGSYEVRCGGQGSADWPREHPTERIRPPGIWSESTKTCQRLTARRVAAALRAGLFGTNDVGGLNAEDPASGLGGGGQGGDEYDGGAESEGRHGPGRESL